MSLTVLSAVVAASAGLLIGFLLRTSECKTITVKTRQPRTTRHR